MAISKLGHNGHYGYFPLLAIKALNMAINMVFMGVFFEIQQKCSSTLKTVSNNMHLAKNYDQTKFFAQIMAISFAFGPNFSASLRDP
jgi:hypothetical protein